MFRNVLLKNRKFKKCSYNVTQKRHFSNLDNMVPEKMKPFWNHPAGPKTIFFWAPLFKWALVFAGLADINRDPSTLSLTQSLSLGLTGLIWSKYSLAITPKNYLLFSVNVFILLIQGYQLYRIFTYKPIESK